MRKRFPNRRAQQVLPRACFVVVMGMVLWAFVARRHALAAAPGASGIDGYYYAIQLRSLLAGEGLYYPSTPLAFRLMLPFTLFGDPIVATKLSAAFWTSLAAVPVYVVVRQVTASCAPALVGATLIAVSRQSFFFCAEYVKNGIAITLALLCFAALATALDARVGRGRWWGAMAAALLVATCLAHRAAFGLALWFCLPPLLVRLARPQSGLNEIPNPKRILPRLGLGAALALSVLILVGSFFPGSLFSLADLSLLTGLMDRGAGLDQPVPVLVETTCAAAVAVALSIALVAPMVTRRRRRRQTGMGPTDAQVWRGHAGENHALLIGPIVYAIAVACLKVTDPQGLALRLQLMSFTALAICAPVLLTSALGLAPPMVRVGAPLSVATAMMFLLPKAYDHGQAGMDARRTVVAALPRYVPPDATVIVSWRQLAYYIKWETQIEATSHVPGDADPESTFRLLEPSMTHSPEFEDFAAHLPPGTPAPRQIQSAASYAMTLVTEPTWQAYLETLPSAQRAEVERWGSW